MQGILGKVPKWNFLGAFSTNEKTHLGPTLNTCKVGTWWATLKIFSFLAIFCSSACACLLVHVRCPLTKTDSKLTLSKNRASSPKKIEQRVCGCMKCFTEDFQELIRTSVMVSGGFSRCFGGLSHGYEGLSRGFGG